MCVRRDPDPRKGARAPELRGAPPGALWGALFRRARGGGRGLVALALGGSLLACAGRGPSSEAPEEEARFDPTVPTGGMRAPGEPSPPPRVDDATPRVSFDDDGDAGPAESLQGPPARRPIPPFKIYGTSGEGPG